MSEHFQKFREEVDIAWELIAFVDCWRRISSVRSSSKCFLCELPHWKQERTCSENQECIPVGCVPAAHWLYAGGGGGWIWSPSISPLGVGLDLIPLNFPLGCGPGSDPPQFPPWVWAWTWSPSISPLGVGLEGGSPSWGVPPSGGGSVSFAGGCLLLGGVCFGGVSLAGGGSAWQGGASFLGGSPRQGALLGWGVPPSWGGRVAASQHALRQTPRGQNHRHQWKHNLGHNFVAAGNKTMFIQAMIAFHRFTDTAFLSPANKVQPLRPSPPARTWDLIVHGPPPPPSALALRNCSPKHGT